MKISDVLKGKIIALKGKGDSAFIIQQQLFKEDNVKISIRSINLIYQKRNDEPKEDMRGRPPLFQESDIEKIKQAIRNNRNITAVDIQRNQRLNPYSASVRTLQTLLNKIGYFARVAPSKPRLSSNNITERNNFAMDLDEWPDEDIQQIIFTDESKVFTQKQGKIYVRCQKGYSIPPRFFEPKELYHGGLEVLVWGAISFNGPVALIRIEETLNSERYINILSKGIFDNKQLDRTFKIFQHDNCGAHRGKNNMEILPWPSKSPDLNLIECIWGYCKNYLYEKRNKIQTKEDVWNFCQKAFFSKECESLIQKLYIGYKNRIYQVLKSEGFHTKY